MTSGPSVPWMRLGPVVPTMVTGRPSQNRPGTGDVVVDVEVVGASVVDVDDVELVDVELVDVVVLDVVVVGMVVLVELVLVVLVLDVEEEDDDVDELDVDVEVDEVDDVDVVGGALPQLGSSSVALAAVGSRTMSVPSGSAVKMSGPLSAP